MIQQGLEERAELILQAATTQLLRWGYQRVTMEDIARAANVGTGTVYLHWKTKRALFETVLLRELLALWHAVDQSVAADPSAALLHRLLGALLGTIRERPLARALFTRDTTLLGTLLRPGNAPPYHDLVGADRLLPLLRELGLLRDDGDPAVQAYAFSAVWTGFSLVEAVSDGAAQPDLATQIAALELTIQQTFAPAQTPPPAVLAATVVPALRAFLADACHALNAAIRAQTIPRA